MVDKTEEKSKSEIWPEVKRCFETKRYELTLIGPEISKRIEDNNGELDMNIFKLKNINFLEIAKTKSSILPKEIGNIVGLTSLLIHTNNLSSVPSEIGLLVNLKNLDLSNNKITELPSDIKNLKELMTLNLSGNQLQSLFPLSELSKLAVLDISRNKFQKLPDDLGSPSLENLAEINASFNVIVELNDNLSELVALKKLNLENNQINHVPASLSQCAKLKDIMLKENKLKDNRLKKLVEQDKGKAIFEYLEKSYAEELKSKPKRTSTTPSKGKKGKNASDLPVEFDLIKVLHSQNEAYQSRDVVQTESVADLRPHILCVILRQINLEGPGNFKKFLAIQTKLHDETCQKRTLATIATHDLENVKSNLVYEAAIPEQIQLVPLGRKYPITAQEYYDKLMEEAELERKAKKRNQLSGIYKYLTLLEGADKFSYLRDSEAIISLPPLSNAEQTKISPSTKNILVEITSSSSLEIRKKVMEELFVEMFKAGITSSIELGEKVEALNLNSDQKQSEENGCEEPNGKLRHTILVQQVKIVDSKGNLKTVFPSRVDLVFEDPIKIKVARLYSD